MFTTILRFINATVFIKEKQCLQTENTISNMFTNTISIHKSESRSLCVAIVGAIGTSPRPTVQFGTVAEIPTKMNNLAIDDFYDDFFLVDSPINLGRLLRRFSATESTTSFPTIKIARTTFVFDSMARCSTTSKGALATSSSRRQIELRADAKAKREFIFKILPNFQCERL